MKVIKETARQTPVACEVDICVVGGSCTGVFAAVRAARLGAKVAIVENNGFFGGVATAGLVHIWHCLVDMQKQRQIIAGLTKETLDRLAARNAVKILDNPTPHLAFILNTEELKIELDELVVQSGVRPFLHARFVSPVVENGRITAVIIEDKTGRRAIAAKYFIDATGDGDVAARAGLAFEKRSDLQPPTTVAIWEHFNRIFEKNPQFNLSAAVFDPKYSEALRLGFLWSAEVPGRPDALMVAGTRSNNTDCSDADQLTRAEIECRSQVRRITDLLRNHYDGGKEIVLANVSSCIGIRETRHIKCLHILSEKEVMTGTRFDDAIANGTYGADVHHSDKAGITMRYLDGTETYNEPGKPPVNSRWRAEAEGVTPFYQIPYRSLVPAGAENLLVAGRLIGADRGAYGAIRVMVNCNQTGEAAGVACVLAAGNGGSVANISVDKLRKTLAAGGSIII